MFECRFMAVHQRRLHWLGILVLVEETTIRRSCQRPYAMLKAPVPSITVVKQHWAQSVLGWVTAYKRVNHTKDWLAAVSPVLIASWGRDQKTYAICVTRGFMGPLGGFWPKLGRKRVTGWKQRSCVHPGRVKTNKQTLVTIFDISTT
jgi:hypothetical protein